jgi:hypothetical protein
VGGQRGVLFDSNQWKSFLAERLRTPVGDTGAITFHAGQHEMLIDHLTSESPITVEARGRVVDEWRLSPGRENHYLDATVMNAEIRIHGRACHSAFPEQVENAIHPAGRVILAIEELARELLRRRERGSSTNRRSWRPACRRRLRAGLDRPGPHGRRMDRPRRSRSGGHHPLRRGLVDVRVDRFLRKRISTVIAPARGRQKVPRGGPRGLGPNARHASADPLAFAQGSASGRCGLLKAV